MELWLPQTDEHRASGGSGDDDLCMLSRGGSERVTELRSSVFSRAGAPCARHTSGLRS